MIEMFGCGTGVMV